MVWCAALAPGVHAVVATLSTNTVRVIASTTTSNDVAAAVEAAGYQCRLIGQGNISVFGKTHPSPCTDPYTLHPAPCTLLPAPSANTYAPYTLNRKPETYP
jgi:hypothetical protein